MPAVQPEGRDLGNGRPIEFSHPTHCPSCNRQYGVTERRSGYNGVECCAGCKAVQQVADFGGLLQELFTSLSQEIEGLKSTIADLSQERV